MTEILHNLILLRPKYLSFRNRVTRSERTLGLYARDGVIVALGLGLMGVIYWLTVWFLSTVRGFSHLAYLSPFVPFSIVFLFLFFMLVISSTVTSLGALFLSRDLDLVLSSPVRLMVFFANKFLYVLFSVGWMSIVFIAPMIIGYAVSFRASWEYYLAAVAVLPPFFVIPTALGMCVSTVIAVVISSRRVKYLLFGVGALFLVWVAAIAELISWRAQNRGDVTQIFLFFRFISFPDEIWLPSHWVASILKENLVSTGTSLLPEYGMLYLVALWMVCLAFILVVLFHEAGYSRSSEASVGSKSAILNLREIFVRIVGLRRADVGALVAKEFRILSRDVPQLLQLILLCGIYVIYLYNIRVFHGVAALSKYSELSLGGILFVMNICIGGFLSTAICTRLVFPSLSYEGRCIWLLTTAPITPRRLLRTKFWCWYVPVLLIASTVFCSGSIALFDSFAMAIVSIICAWVLSYGLVGLAMGFGAVFANFDWEHPSELIASLGSMIFMLSAAGLILASIPLLWVLARFATGELAAIYGFKLALFIVVLCLIGLWGMHVLAARAALDAGERSLIRFAE